MDDKKKTTKSAPAPIESHREGDNLDVEWGETNQERIVERTSRSASKRHRCKGRQCNTAFDKL